MAVILPPSIASCSDVALTSPAQGDVLYRDAGAWKNLPHGSVGQFLQSNGPGANPSWATGSPADISGAVALTPGTGIRNVVAPSGDWEGLTVLGQAAATVAMFNVQQTGTTADPLAVNPKGQGFSVVCQCNDPNDAALFAQATINQVAPPVQVTCSLDGSGNIASFFYVGNDASIHGQLQMSDPTVSRSVYGLFPFLSNNVDATRKGGFILKSKDATAYREVIRGDTDGSQPLISFLGGSVVAKQVGASAAGIASVVDPAAKAALQAFQTALSNYSLLTSPA